MWLTDALAVEWDIPTAIYNPIQEFCYNWLAKQAWLVLIASDSKSRE